LYPVLAPNTHPFEICAEQAQGPFLNPLEQNLPDTKTLCIKIKNSSYAPLFEKVWGKGSLDMHNQGNQLTSPSPQSLMHFPIIS
jgi:hypothetical protein